MKIIIYNMATLTFNSSSSVLNWGSASSWSGGTVPTIGDAVIFDSNSATCSLNLTLATCSSFDASAYTRQFRFNTNALQIFGTAIFGANMGYSFSSTGQFGGYNLAIASSSTITSNGSTISVPTIFYSYTGANNTYTIADYLIISENFSTGSPNAISVTQSINGGTLSLLKNFSINSGGNLTANLTRGTTNIVMAGGSSSISSGANTAGGLSNNIFFLRTGTYSLTSALYLRGTTFSIGGTPSFSGSFLLNVTGANLTTTINATGCSSNYILPIGLGSSTTVIIALAGDFHTSRGISTSGATISGNNIYVYGGSVINVTNNLTGATIRVAGTSSSSTTSLSATTNIYNNMVINTPGSANFTTNFLWGGSSFVYTAGSVTFSTAGNNTFVVILSNTASQVLDTNGMSFQNVQINNTGTASLNSNMNVNGNIVLQGSADVRFAGTGQWTTNGLIYTGNPATTRLGLGLSAGLTYTVTNNLSILPTNMTGNIFCIRSMLPGVQTNFVYTGTSQSVSYTVGTDINSNGGNTIWVFYQGSTASRNTNNWSILTPSSVQSASFFC